MGSANFDDGVYINTLPDIRYWAGRMKAAAILPELEIFEGGMIDNVRIIQDEGLLPFAPFYAFALGFRGALSASPGALAFLRGLLPPGARWGLIHHGMGDLSLLAAAAGLGADTIRVGYEDSALYAPDKVGGEQRGARRARGRAGAADGPGDRLAGRGAAAARDPEAAVGLSSPVARRRRRRGGRPAPPRRTSGCCPRSPR